MATLHKMATSEVLTTCFVLIYFTFEKYFRQADKLANRSSNVKTQF